MDGQHMLGAGFVLQAGGEQVNLALRGWPLRASSMAPACSMNSRRRASGDGLFRSRAMGEVSTCTVGRLSMDLRTRSTMAAFRSRRRCLCRATFTRHPDFAHFIGARPVRDDATVSRLARNTPLRSAPTSSNSRRSYTSSVMPSSRDLVMDSVVGVPDVELFRFPDRAGRAWTDTFDRRSRFSA